MAGGTPVLDPTCRKCGRLAQKRERGMCAVLRCKGCGAVEDACYCPPLPKKLVFGEPPPRGKRPE